MKDLVLNKQLRDMHDLHGCSHQLANRYAVRLTQSRYKRQFASHPHQLVMIGTLPVFYPNSTVDLICFGSKLLKHLYYYPVAKYSVWMKEKQSV